MKFKSMMWMTATVDKKSKKDGLEFDIKHFEGMKPNGIKLIGSRGDYIIGIEKNGTKYVKLILGWHKFELEDDKNETKKLS